MKILIISLAGIGDTLFATPLIKEIRQNYPQGIIDVLVMWKGAKEVLENNPNVNRIYQFDMFKRGFSKTMFFCKKLRKEKYNVSINTFPQSKTHYRIMALLIGAKMRISHEYDNSNFLDKFLINHSAKQDYNIHAIENNLNLLRFIGERKLKDRAYELNLSKSEKEKAKKFIKEKGFEGKNLIGFHVGSQSLKNLALRRWPLKNYYELIKKLLENKNVRILLFGGPKELKENLFLIDKINDDRVLLVKTDKITETASIIESCKFFISVDTVLMHIAAAMKVPHQIVIRTPTYNKTVEPYRKDFLIIGGKLQKNIEYRYDGKGIYGKKEDILAYMNSITPEMVYDSIVGLLR